MINNYLLLQTFKSSDQIINLSYDHLILNAHHEFP